MYIKSVDLTIQDYSKLLHDTKLADLRLPNKDFDTGMKTEAGEYSLTDKAYEKLLDQLADKHFEHLTPELQENILEFYSDLNAPFGTKKNKKTWSETLANLEKLKTPPSPCRNCLLSTGEIGRWDSYRPQTPPILRRALGELMPTDHPTTDVLQI